MKKLLVVAAVLAIISGAQANELVGIPTIIDGDTIKVMDETVRFAHVDTPECGQVPWGKLATDHLMELIGGKVITVEYDKRGKYGRIIGTLYLGDTNINLKMVEDGYASWYQKYSNDTTYGLAEDNALKYHKGIVGKYRAPWEYRHSTPWAIRKHHSCSLNE